jgi:hypothetical protein
MRRRWRLWWRFQLRAIPWRRPFRRLRLLRSPDSDVGFRRLQLAVGRILGRWYLWIVRQVERARIARARVPDRVEPARTTVALLKLRRSLLGGLVVLILLGLALDAFLRGSGADLSRAIGIDDWLRETFSRPSDETMRNLLAAAAGGTATILGLVLSISLIAWQTTADRFRSTSIVAFLLRERTGAAVVRLLAVGFAYSLWVLALLEVVGERPYASVGLALAISTAAVLSLISYRQAGLLGYLPDNIALSLRREMVSELARARRPGAGRSVEDYSRRVVSGDLRIFEDLIGRLLRDGDAADVAACVKELGKTLSYHVRAKHRLHPDSLFFERHKERLSSDGMDIEESLVSEGLMNPTTDVPDHLWVERRVMKIMRLVAGSPMREKSEVAEALLEAWATALQYAWYFEDSDAVDLILDEVQRAGADPKVRQSRELAEEFMSIPWVLVETVGQRQGASAEAIVDTAPWQNADQLRELPWRAQQDARELGRRVRREVEITGRVVSPHWAIVAEVERLRGPRLEDLRARMAARAVKLCRDQLDAAAEEAAEGAPVVARMMLRSLLRMTHHDLPLPEIDDLVPAFVRAVDLAKGAEADDLRQDAARGARTFAQSREWQAAYAMLSVAAAASIMARMHESDERRSVILLFDNLFTAAAVHGWGEYHRCTDHVAAAGRYVQAPFVEFDRLADLIENHSLVHLMLPRITYHRWFQPLMTAVHELPERPMADGGTGFSSRKDHQSELIARAALLFGPEECLEHLVTAVAEERRLHRARLVVTLGAVRDRRSES